MPWSSARTVPARTDRGLTATDAGLGSRLCKGYVAKSPLCKDSVGMNYANRPGKATLSLQRRKKPDLIGTTSRVRLEQTRQIDLIARLGAAIRGGPA